MDDGAKIFLWVLGFYISWLLTYFLFMGGMK